MTYINVTTKHATLKFEILENKKVALIQVNSNDLSALTEQQKQQLTITEVQITGENFHHKGLNFVNTTPGTNLIYQSYQVDERDNGKVLKITSQDNNQQLVVDNFYQLFDETSIIKSWVTIHNIGNENLGIEYVSSFAMTGINQGKDLKANFATHNLLYTPHNNWQAEAQWQQQTLKEAGLDYWTDIVDDQQNSTKRISVTNNSS